MGNKCWEIGMAQFVALVCISKFKDCQALKSF